MSPILQGLQEGAQKVRALPERADQILLGLTHSGAQLLDQTLKRIESNPNDLIGRVSRSVLERAELIRKAMQSSQTRASETKAADATPVKVRKAAKARKKTQKSKTTMGKTSPK